MIYTYPAIFMKYKNYDSYGVYFPDLDEITNGNDLNDAMYMARDLLSIVLSTMLEDKQTIPSPSNINSIEPDKIIHDLRRDFTDKERKQEEIEEYFVNYISVDVDKYAKKYITKYDKKTVTIPHLLNVKGKEANVNFSKLLTEALIAYLK